MLAIVSVVEVKVEIYKRNGRMWLHDRQGRRYLSIKRKM